MKLLEKEFERPQRHNEQHRFLHSIKWELIMFMNVLMNEKLKRLLFFTVCLRPQIAKANRGVHVVIVIIKLQQY